MHTHTHTALCLRAPPLQQVGQSHHPAPPLAAARRGEVGAGPGVEVG